MTKTRSSDSLGISICRTLLNRNGGSQSTCLSVNRNYLHAKFALCANSSLFSSHNAGKGHSLYTDVILNHCTPSRPFVVYTCVCVCVCNPHGGGFISLTKNDRQTA